MPIIMPRRYSTDTAVKSVLNANKRKSKYFQITREGKICDDSESDDETSDEKNAGEIEDEEKH